MEPNINNSNESDPIDEIDSVEEIDIEVDETIEDRPRGRGRGRRGMHGRGPFGPNRPYRFALFVEEDGSYLLRSPDLADRAAEVGSLDEIGAAMRVAIEQRTAEDAVAAAEAEKDDDYSGKFVLRLPRSMHRHLSELAEAEGVSLNQLALAFLAQGMGRTDATQELGERRGPRGGHRGPGGHGPRGGRGRHGGRGPDGHGPKERGPEGRGPEGRGPGGRGFGRRHWGDRGPGFGPESGRGMGRGRRSDIAGYDADRSPASPEGAQLV
jgi:antitoxin HicB